MYSNNSEERERRCFNQLLTLLRFIFIIITVSENFPEISADSMQGLASYKEN